MDKQIIQIESVNVSELTDIISDKLIEKLEAKISFLIQKSSDDELLTREETAKLLKINVTTLWNWTNKGKLIAYGIGNRVYYKRGEIMNALIAYKSKL
ncbi:helix-turn-helix domain-containing protein [Flavobacterium sp.]|uniref:helix-turn-helix domain-containing protein n=1 Tax=Flavobacterium sp. TaxID=239 RepID=UPI0039E42DEA